MKESEKPVASYYSVGSLSNFKDPMIYGVLDNMDYEEHDLSKLRLVDLAGIQRRIRFYRIGSWVLGVLSGLLMLLHISDF